MKIVIKKWHRKRCPILCKVKELIYVNKVYAASFIRIYLKKLKLKEIKFEIKT